MNIREAPVPLNHVGLRLTESEQLTVGGKLTGALLLEEEMTVESKCHIFPHVSRRNLLREKKESPRA